MSRPYPGDPVLMPCMGDDVRIRVGSVADEQPRLDEGVFAVLDQYGERHEIEMDADSWVTVSPVL